MIVEKPPLAFSSLPLPFSLSLTRTRTHSHSHTYSHTLTQSLSHLQTCIHTHSLSYTHTYSRAHTHTLSHTHKVLDLGSIFESIHIMFFYPFLSCKTINFEKEGGRGRIGVNPQQKMTKSIFSLFSLTDSAINDGEQNWLEFRFWPSCWLFQPSRIISYTTS